MKIPRKELKFIVSDATLLDVKYRISGIMQQDVHQDGDHYRVRSVYLDDRTYSCYRENAAGVSPREKYRLRTYNCSIDRISAEIKTNYRNTTSKISTGVSRDIYEAIVSADPGRISAALSQQIAKRADAGDVQGKHILEKYLNVLTARGYGPSCIVDYERSAFVYPVGNVRITLDRNITASEDLSGMFDTKFSGRCALYNNRHILEIKYDEFLPDEIRSLLAGVDLFRESCSKYILSLNSLKQMEA